MKGMKPDPPEELICEIFDVSLSMDFIHLPISQEEQRWAAYFELIRVKMSPYSLSLTSAMVSHFCLLLKALCLLQSPSWCVLRLLRSNPGLLPSRSRR